MTDKLNVRASVRQLNSGRICSVRAHQRRKPDGMSDDDTEEHKLFVKKVKYLLLDYKVRFILNPGDTDYFSKVTNEVWVSDRRCDLLIESSGEKKTCVECQISPLKSDELYNRTLTYLRDGHEVMWVRYLGVHYQRMYYWLIDDCNSSKKIKNSKLGDEFRLMCKKKYKAGITKAFGLIFIKFLKEVNYVRKDK